MKEGKIVNAIPAPSRVSKYKINWDEFVEVSKLAKSPVLVASNIRETQVKSMRLYTRYPFVQEDGRVKIALRNSHIKDGVRVGEVYFEWIPNDQSTTTTDTKDTK
jgi:hypothetical protein